MGLLSQLNCFSNSKKKGSKRTPYDDDGDGDGRNRQQLLLPSKSGSNSSSPTRRGDSDASGSPGRDPQHDDVSIPTVDPDYNHVRASNFSVSDVDGTVGSQNQSLTNFSHAASAFGSMAPSRLGDGSSMTGAERRMYASHLIGSPQPPGKEEMVEVRAPRGKLGLVIDTPDNSSTPVVHAIKDTCPIRSQIFVGDKLVAVDEVDVREMTAQEVSSLIGRRMNQESRRLTIIRGASFSGAGNGMY